MDHDNYQGREQTLVKHSILRQYLRRFAIIVGRHWDTLTYVDCFSGPWKVQSEELADTSFSIALEELRTARTALHNTGRDVSLRCFFLEKDATAYARLRDFAAARREAAIQTKNAALETSVPDILDFVRAGGPRSFPFILIDPTGWTGFSMDMIAPLLQLNPGEVLINFMTGFIRRFLESPQEETQESFERLFGSVDFRDRIQGLSSEDRENAAVEAYAANVRRVGGYTHTCSAIVLHPQINRTHFHLTFATRNRKGVEVFKEAEKKAMEVQESARAIAQDRRREQATGQRSLLTPEEMHDPAYYNGLRERHLTASKARVVEMLRASRRVSYDDLWEAVLSQPLTWESDLKAWIRDWRERGMVGIEGLSGRQRVPRLDHHHYVTWKRELH